MEIWDDLAGIVAVAGQVCVGLVFIVAGAQKMRHWSILRGVIANYRLLPEEMVAPAASLLPLVEAITGIALLSGVAWPQAQLAAILLLGLFAAAMAINIERGRSHIDCGCNQSFLRQPLRRLLVARNGVLIVALLPSLALAGTVSPLALPAGLAAGVAFFLLYMLVNVFAALPKAGLAMGAGT
ncbi:MAG TPA: MauE/DoxX family redox-associated membrane protein [Rhizomicrobium sp.]|jgi:uncharacterized membrane protein YphA (DoxX/SURF4 family)|nr:MauE/DoxX family redox-associated membrane protein [Rhizomicrobium sp.]